MNDRVHEPRVLPDQSAMATVLTALRRNRFGEASCASRFGVHPVTGIKFKEKNEANRSRSTESAAPWSILGDLFLLNRRVPAEQLAEVLSKPETEAIEEMRLIERSEDTFWCPFNLFPCRDLYILTDRRPYNVAINQVMWLFPESFLLAYYVHRLPVARALDLCTGSGIHALLAAEHSAEVIGVDINPRAIAFAEFNRALNGIERCKFRRGDLYAPGGEMQFDLILANPPYNPCLNHASGSNWYSGGPWGDEILSRILEGLDARLTRNGQLHMVSILAHRVGVSWKTNMRKWLGDLASFDVLIFGIPIADYVGPAERHDEFSGFELALISIRRHLTSDSASYYHEVPTHFLPFFDSSGEASFGPSRPFFDTLPRHRE